MPRRIPATSPTARGAPPTPSDPQTPKDPPTMDLVSIAIAVAFFAAMIVAIDLLERV
jgi:hypothetical protein